MCLLTSMVNENVPRWGYSDNTSHVRVGAIPHPQLSLFLLFSQDCLFPGRPRKCQGVSRATSSTEPDNVLSANSSSSVNIWSVGVALLLFLDCTSYVHVLMGFWRALFSVWIWSHRPLVLCCVLIQDLTMLFRKEKVVEVGTNLPKLISLVCISRL